MIKIAICDDEPDIAHKIEEILRRYTGNNGIKIETSLFFDGTGLVNRVLDGERYDLIYLDIKMKELDGINAVRRIRAVDRAALIIFVSNHNDYIQELLEVEAFRFLGKPVDKELFIRYFMEACKKIYEDMTYFEYRYQHELFRLPVIEIVYFESRCRKTVIHMINGEESFNSKLDEVESSLTGGKYTFYRIHQSFLVSRIFIRSVSGSSVKLNNKCMLPVSGERRQQFLENFSCKMKNNDVK